MPPSNLFNYDETNMADDAGKKKWLYRSAKNIRKMLSPLKIISFHHVLCVSFRCSAAPYVIYNQSILVVRTTAAALVPDSTERKVIGCCITEWFMSTLLLHANNLPGEKVLIGDNLLSHFIDEVSDLYIHNNIAFLYLSPNSIHLT